MEKYKFMQLAQAIRDGIDTGEYAVGKPLPGERALAQAYSVSRQTVRRAIDALCAEEVLQKVHGSGNYVLKRTRRPKSGLIAVIATHIALPNFASTLLSIEKNLADSGYYPIITNTGNRFDAERRALEDLLEKSVDGLIVEGVLSTVPNPNIGLYRQAVALGIPLVFINTYYKEIKEAVSLTMDNKQGGELCGNYLLSRGHRKFAGVFKADDQESMQRYSSLARYVSEHGQPLSDNNLLWYTSGNLHKPLEQFALSHLEECTAVVCFNDEIAFALYEILQHHGVVLPANFTFVAFDKTDFSHRIPHKIITLKYPQDAMGKLAAKKIMHMVEGRAETSTRLQWQLFDAMDNILPPRDIPE